MVRAINIAFWWGEGGRVIMSRFSRTHWKADQWHQASVKLPSGVGAQACVRGADS